MTTAVPKRIVKGDATSPQAKGPKVIAHVSNDLGGWGKGFVLAISRDRIEPLIDGALCERGVPVTVCDFDA